MSRIYLKGAMPPVEVSPAEAGMAQHALEEGRHGAVITLGSLTVKVSEIKAIVVDQPKSISPYTEALSQYDENLRKFRQLPIATKVSKNLGFVKCLFKIFKQDLDNQTEIEELLYKFHSANPERCLPNLEEFESFIPNRHTDSVGRMIYKALSLAVVSDIQNAKHATSQPKQLYANI